MHIVRG